ncbi:MULTISPECIES: PEP-CTERM sorting domain-containing protein [unclassified Lentimonas]|uniref:PEP-CTERM sorting domain-containing protein n=1 Tax=unclassified Lentimonas TaxID=2630993 RepID=UPI0013213B46|nr:MULTISPECIES: PEP-CTERM sorting domain-containing protein [unclassified Lentimonas]CAA6690036.1 Unannotated [Lentimonas sp. CC10]CAA6691112.1 Unannotated [Lentimonas sp. CC19]CAA7069275.1 Unannotated [Lentimonas sp. CC11]
MKKHTSLVLLTSLAACVVSNAAIISNGDFDTAPPTAYSNSSAASAYDLDTATGNVVLGAIDTGIDENQWFQTTVNGAPSYSATGGNGGGGGMVMNPAGNTDNKPRAVLQFAQDDKATTGTVSITIDFKFNNTDTGMFGNVELFGWNAPGAGPELSVGGPTANSAAFNATVLNDAVNLLGGTGVAIDSSGFTADTWQTATIIGSLDLVTGYDFYAWRVGFYGADGTPDGDIASFDNLVVVPEPGTYALLGGLTGLVSVMLRRRR